MPEAERQTNAQRASQPVKTVSVQHPPPHLKSGKTYKILYRRYHPPAAVVVRPCTPAPGLMPGTEYQFRLRAYSNGSWQAKEESIVSSPFKTICSPPDPPPACPRARQLALDPLVVGGLPDTGALLSAKTVEASCEICRSGGGGGGGGGDVKTPVGIGMRAAGAVAAAAASAAAIDRGKAQAEAERNNGGGVSGLGGVFKSGHSEGCRDDNADVDRSGFNDACKGSSESKVEMAVDNGESRFRRSSDGRRDRQQERRRKSCTKEGNNDDEQEEEEEEKEEEARMGHKHTRRRRSSGSDAEDHGRPPILLPALADKAKGSGHRAEEEKSEEVGNEGQSMSAVVEAEPDAKGSTTMVLEWDSGCTNGAITTNYEVRIRETLKGKNLFALLRLARRRRSSALLEVEVDLVDAIEAPRTTDEYDVRNKAAWHCLSPV